MKLTHTVTHTVFLTFLPPSTCIGLAWAKNTPLWQQLMDGAAKVNKPSPGTCRERGGKEKEGSRERETGTDRERAREREMEWWRKRESERNRERERLPL